MQENQNQTRRQKAELYLQKHRVQDLFQDLCSALTFKQPSDIDGFIIEQLQNKQKYGFKTSIQSDEEIGNIFCLFDLKREGMISRKQCVEALKVLSDSAFQVEQIEDFQMQIPEKVDIAQFVRYCDTVIGVKMQI